MGPRGVWARGGSRIIQTKHPTGVFSIRKHRQTYLVNREKGYFGLKISSAKASGRDPRLRKAKHFNVKLSKFITSKGTSD